MELNAHAGMDHVEVWDEEHEGHDVGHEVHDVEHVVHDGVHEAHDVEYVVNDEAT